MIRYLVEYRDMGILDTMRTQYTVHTHTTTTTWTTTWTTWTSTGDWSSGDWRLETRPTRPIVIRDGMNTPRIDDDVDDDVDDDDDGRRTTDDLDDEKG
jgi:hypothetical protein